MSTDVSKSASGLAAPAQDIVPGGEVGEGEVPTALQEAIGSQLKKVYGQMLSDPLPDKFVELLSALSKGETAK